MIYPCITLIFNVTHLIPLLYFDSLTICMTKINYKNMTVHVCSKIHPRFCIHRPDSPTTFPGTCKRNFLCLQMILFEFLREDSIG